MTNLFKKLPLDDLVDMLIKGTQELIDMGHINEEAFEDKKTEVLLLQKAIASKRADFTPL